MAELVNHTGSTYVYVHICICIKYMYKKFVCVSVFVRMCVYDGGGCGCVSDDDNSLKKSDCVF